MAASTLGGMVHPGDWTRPAGAGPVRVIAVAGRSATRRESCSLVTVTTGEPSRSFHGEGSIRPTGVAEMLGSGPSGVGGSARTHGPTFAHGGNGGKRKGMAGTAPPNHPEGRPPAPADLRRLQNRLWAAAEQSPGRRFHALYVRIHRPDGLWEAWQRVGADRGAAGTDGLTLAAVEDYGVRRMLDFLREPIFEVDSSTWPSWNRWELTRAEFTDGAGVLNHMAFAGMTLSVGLRRVAPLACAAVAGSALTVQTIWGRDVYGSAGQFVALLIATHAVGGHPDRRRAWIGLAVVFVGVESFPFVSDEPVVLAHKIGNTAVFVAVWGLARAVQAVTEQRERLRREQAAQERAAVERERARVARELHNIVAHGLSLMVLHSSAARSAVSGASDDVQRSLAVIEDVGRDAMGELHRLLGMLGSSEEEPDAMASPNDLDDLCARTRALSLDVTLSMGPTDKIDRSVELSAYRIVQEGLTNALRYAGDSRVVVTVARTTGDLEVVVRDQREGSTPPRQVDISGSGRGLRGLRERVELLGGRFDAGAIDRGWQVRALPPIGGDP